MQLNAILTNLPQKVGRENSKNVTNSITSTPKTMEGYAPVTASLWGKNTAGVNYFGSYVTFGAPRPTNNPADLPKIEADTQSGFKLSSLEHPVICPDCGRPVMTKPIFAAIKGELDSVNDSQSYLNVIESHNEFLYPQERKILTNLEKKLSKNPDLSIRDVVAHERVKRLDKLERKQLRVLDKIEEVAEVLPYEDRARVTGLMRTSSQIIFQRENNYAFQRSKFIELAEGLDLKDKAAQSEILKLAAKLPSSMNNEDAWYVKYGGVDGKKQPYTSRTIAEKLVSPTYTNTDHIHPWNLGGYDATSNFWLMHARCNIIKTDKPFVEWLNEDRDNRVKYMKEYLTSTQEAIDCSEDKKMHPKYDLYAAKIAKTIYYETDGEVDFTKDFPLPEGYDVPRPQQQGKNSEKA